MHLSHLSLTHFRNYQRLELDLTGKLTLLLRERPEKLSVSRLYATRFKAM